MPVEFTDEEGNKYVVADDEAVQLRLKKVSDTSNVLPDPPLPDPPQPEPPQPEPPGPEPPPKEPDPKPPETPKDALKRLIDVSWGKHDAPPKGGNPGWDWFSSGRGGTSLPGGHVNAWGQVFAVEGTPTYDVDLELRNARMFFLRRDGTWYEPIKLVNPPVEGAFWNGKFQGLGAAQVVKIGDVYRVSLKRLAEPQVVTFHWWYKSFYPRVTVPSDVIGVVNVAEARLSGPNATIAKMICSVGGDVWPVPTGGKPEGTQVSAMCQPRMTWLTDSWQLFGGVSYPKGSTDKAITPEMLRKNPPPL